MKNYQTKTGLFRSPRLRWFQPLCLIGLLTQVQAQEDEGEEDVYEISPFVVQDEGDTGYIATSTLAGTRLRSSLEDIGASVQVITTEFLEDIGATESTDLLLYTTATETAGLGGNFSGGSANADDRVVVGGVLSNPQGANRVRGLGAPDNTRDFFLTDIPFENYNTGRIEINRGANAILFGLGSPSGVLNAGLNRALFDTINSVDFRIQDGGKHFSTRGTVDFNRVLIEDRLAIRINALQSDRSYSQEPAFQDQERYYVTATWTPLQNTNIRVSYENGHIRANNPDPVGPLQAIDHYIREIGRLHAAQLLDPDYADAAPLALVYDPWNTSMRATDDLNQRLNQQIDGVDVYPNPFGNQGLGQSLAMVWGSDTVDPDFGFVAVIPNAANQRPDLDGNSQNGFTHKVYYDAARPAQDVASLPANQRPRNPRGGRNFWRIDNAGSTTTFENDFNRSGAYEGFNDLDLFDFSKHLLSGTAPFQNRDFDAFHATLEQTFFDNKLGFELAFAEQHFRRKQMHGFPGRTMGIMIDVNKTLPIGSFHHNTDPFTPVTPEANPNFGRPFMVGKTNESRLTSDRRTWRWTGFWEFDTEDWFGDNLFSQILGRSVLTGLASRSEVETKNIALSQREFGPREANLNENFDTRPDPRHFDYLVYLGPAVDLESNPAGITRDMFEINPIHNQNVWNPGTFVTTTYFDFGKQEMVTYDIERRLAGVNGENNGTVNDSLAAIMQSFLLDDNVVTTLGWRQDEVTNLLANTPILVGTATGDEYATRYDITNNNYHYVGTVAETADGEYLFEDPEMTFVKEDIFSWGAVAKLPKEWNPFEWLDSASIFYNTSENFQPAPGREDHLGRQLPSPTGETEDLGFNFTFGGGKYTLRINRFEAAINNANNNTVNRVFAQAAPGAIQGFVNNMLSHLAFDDFDEVAEDEDVNDPNYNVLNHIPRSEAVAMFHEYTNHLGASVDLDTGAINLDQSNPLHRLWIENNWRLTFDGGVPTGLDQNQAGQTDTLDQVSKGYELELVANPTRGLRVLLNVAKVETANSNIAPVMRRWIEEEFGPWHAGTPTNPSRFGAVHRGNPFLKPEFYPNNNLNVTQYTNEVIRDWEVIKAQEGTFSPE
ncbi:MAG: TonB-dependent receptor plug domain-containing protein, partial [Verrucomicrobiae bacterium]|nr:TonB-dependent receptor plug domain-containing protein [Verrucomicrobiae bacterium]